MSWKDLLKTLSPVKADKLPGYLTQYPGITDNHPKQHLVMGVDFGTAFTKVVIGGAVNSYAVPFAPIAAKENIFLLPCVLSIDSSGECRLGMVDGAARSLTDLKMRLLQGDYSQSCLSEISAFLALVIRHCRAWMLNEHHKIYQGKYLDWYINVGLPTDSYHDKRLTEIYTKLVMGAWTASIGSGSININHISRLVENSLNGNALNIDDAAVSARQLQFDAIGLIPEFVAQITGYVRSPMRQPDLHALVDVGAGTVDTTMFNVHEKDGEDKFPIFAKSVKPLGVHYLIRHRIDNSSYTGGWTVGVHDNPPPKVRFARQLALPIQKLDEIDLPFRRKVLDQLISVMRYTREERYRKSRHWEEGVPLFFCGGGSKMDFYIELIASIEANGPYRIRKTSLPRPDRLIANKLPRDAYDRLSVAYGLSFDALDIGEIIEASEIENERDTWVTASSTCDLCKGTGEPMGRCPKCGGSGFFSR